jgi:ATP-dependent DNA helicase RecQ
LLYAPQDIVTNRFLIENAGEGRPGNEADPRFEADPQLNSRNKAEEYKKLQVMVDYCHIDTCLRAYILRYFGMTDVTGQCAHCANCDLAREEGSGSGGGGAAVTTDITIETQKIISCVVRMGNRFGSGLVSQVLRGADTQRIRSLGFQHLSTYGIMRDYPEKTIKEIIAYLTAHGYLELTSGEYPVLMAGKKARQFLREKETLVMRRALSRPKQGAPGQAQAGLSGVRLGHDRGELFARLKDLRKEIAEKSGVPPYVVFSDASLAGMCALLPCSPEEMLAVSGVGRYKLEHYGEAFMAVVRAYAAEQKVTEQQVTEQQGLSRAKRSGEETGPAKTKRVKGETVLATFELYEQGQSVAEIAARRALSVITIEDHLVRAFALGLAVNPQDFIPEKHREALFAAIAEQGTERLRPIKDAVDPEVSYGAIRFAVEVYKRECRKSQGGVGTQGGTK